MIVLRVGGHVGEQCWHITHPGHMIGRATADHILPYDHSQTITVVIPAQRLDLDMFPEHVEAQAFCKVNIIDKGLIAGSGHQSVGPVALIQDPMEKIGLVIQAEAGDTTVSPSAVRVKGYSQGCSGLQGLKFTGSGASAGSAAE